MLLKDDDTFTRMHATQPSERIRSETVRRVKQDGKGVGFRELVETLLGDMVGSQAQCD